MYYTLYVECMLGIGKVDRTQALQLLVYFSDFARHLGHEYAGAAGRRGRAGGRGALKCDVGAGDTKRKLCGSESGLG